MKDFFKDFRIDTDMIFYQVIYLFFFFDNSVITWVPVVLLNIALVMDLYNGWLGVKLARLKRESQQR